MLGFIGLPHDYAGCSHTDAVRGVHRDRLWALRD